MAWRSSSVLACLRVCRWTGRLSPLSLQVMRSSIRSYWPKRETRLVVKMLKVISRASFQRSSTIHFGTLSAEPPFQPAPPNHFSCYERHVYDRLAIKRWFYANNRESKQHIQKKIHAETRFRFPSFSRFGRCSQKSCGISKIAEDLLSRRSGYECDLHSKRRCKALRC